MPRLRDKLSRRAVALALGLAASSAQAGIVFTPHLSEYGILPPGQYTEFTTVFTEIEHIYDKQGNKIKLGLPFVPAGASTDAALGLIKYLWVGNIFRDTNVPILNTRPQFCRGIGVLGYQQNTEQIAARTRIFGLKPGANGLGDVFVLCGVYGQHHRWGPISGNGLLATTVKFPVGSYDTDAALNIGTNYWTYIPQFAFHGDVAGRLMVDGTFAWQFNGDNATPSFGGLTPTRPADVRNAEINFAWKWNERFFTDVGYSYRGSVGPNYYDKITVANEEPLRADDTCKLLDLSGPLCDSTDRFFVAANSPIPLADRGVNGTMITAGFVYIYRTTSVFNFRIAKPIKGQGSQITVPFNVYNAIPNAQGGYTRGGCCVSTTTSELYGVQEAAAVSASPYLELRFVYLFWAP